MNRVVESVTLHYTDDRSDKVYRIDLIEVSQGDQIQGYIVIGYNGRRNASKLTPQSKTTAPTSYRLAKQIFDDLEERKCSPGYKTPYHVFARSTPGTIQPPPAKPTGNKSRTKPAEKEEDEATQTKAPKHRMDMLEF